MQFRKKPIIVEAFQVPISDEQTRPLPPSWLLEAVIRGKIKTPVGGGLDIETLEGTMHANIGDWIIQGVNGELYPCKPDIFATTYEPVGEL